MYIIAFVSIRHFCPAHVSALIALQFAPARAPAYANRPVFGYLAAFDYGLWRRAKKMCAAPGPADSTISYMVRVCDCGGAEPGSGTTIAGMLYSKMH